jgi:predicted small lipoprotein YifL
MEDLFMKKLISLIFVFMLALSLAACGDSGHTQGDDTAKLPDIGAPSVSA